MGKNTSNSRSKSYSSTFFEKTRERRRNTFAQAFTAPRGDQAALRYFHTTPVVSQGPVFQQAQIARAVELGLGVDSPYKVKLVTADQDSAAFAAEIQEILVSG